MNRGQLSKKERKARIRFIQSHRYNHIEQQILDDYVHSYGSSYTRVWNVYKTGGTLMIDAIVGAHRLACAMSSIGCSVKQAADAFNRLSHWLKESQMEETA